MNMENLEVIDDNVQCILGQLIRHYKKGPSQCTLKKLRGAHSQ